MKHRVGSHFGCLSLTLTLTLRLPLSRLPSSLKSVLLFLNRPIAVETLEIEIHRGSFLERTLLGLGSDGDIHSPDHILLGVS